MKKRKIISVQHAAEILGKSRETVYQYIESGLLENASEIHFGFAVYADQLKTLKTPKRGRPVGSYKPNPKHPRLQAYYQQRSKTHA